MEVRIAWESGIRPECGGRGCGRCCGVIGRREVSTSEICLQRASELLHLFIKHIPRRLPHVLKMVVEQRVQIGLDVVSLVRAVVGATALDPFAEDLPVGRAWKGHAAGDEGNWAYA